MFSISDGNDRIEAMDEQFIPAQRDDSKIAVLLQEGREGLLHRQTRKIIPSYP